MPRLAHPDLDEVIDAAESRVPVLEKSGWVVIDDDTPKPEPRSPRSSHPAPAPVSDPADPALAGTHEE